MSTRGAVGFRFNGKDYIAYNHSDSYPEGLGVEVLEATKTLLKTNRTAVENSLKHLKLVTDKVPPTARDIEILSPYANLSVGEQSTADWYCLLRNLQGDLIQTLKVGYMSDSHDFLSDSLFCEWAYILNFDENKLEVYKGFNTAPNGRGRYASLHRERDGEYYGVTLIKVYNFSKLPSNERFLEEVLKVQEDIDNEEAEAETEPEEKPNKLPLVQFEYPRSDNPVKETTRYVRVVQMDETYLKGYDIPSEDYTDDGEFKTFRIDRMKSPVSLIRFNV